MPSSNSSPRNATTESSVWVEFSPFDELMDDIEQQMNQQDDAMVGMKKQLEEIEVSLSSAVRTRQPKAKKPPSSSLRSAVSFTKQRSYVSMGDDSEDQTENDSPVDPFSASARKRKILEILQRRSDLKRYSGAGIPTNTSRHNPQDALPPSQIQSPRRSLDPTKASSPRMESPPTTRPSTSRTSPDLRIAKPFQSSSTWGESESSNQSSSSDGVVSDLGETTFYSEKTSTFFASRKLKYVLVFMIAMLVLMIGILMGLWVQQRQANKAPSSSMQQVEQSIDSQVIDPVFVNNTVVVETTPEVSQVDNIEGISPTQANDSVEETLPTATATPTKNPTMPPTTAPTNVIVNQQTSGNTKYKYDYTANSDYLVGVYYYPWHGARFHNEGGYMRKELNPPHVPTLGEYNDSDPAVIARHMEWFRQANIGLLVTSWWGPNRLEDSNTKDVIMEHEDVGNLKIALHYETTSRLGDGREKLPNARSDIKYMCENYFDHPNYYKIDGRPVLFIYISRKLHTVGTLEEALLTMRSTASKCGHNLYLIGDSVFESAPDPNEPHVPFWYFDAVTNYDVYGSSGRPDGHVGTDGVDNYYRQQNEWKEQASREDCRYIPAVSPGYNDRGVRMEADHPPLSRRITQDSAEGSLFHYQLKQAKRLVDSNVDKMILVNSFNEWHEDTQIEPVTGNPATQPFNFTKGLEYEGYGELYLNILGTATSKDPSLHNIFDYLF